MKDIIVIKCGGSMIDSLSDEFYKSIKALKDSGLHPVIVHGGGPAINQMLDELKIESEFHNGLRKTTSKVMDVVEMVLSGSMTNTLVRNLAKYQLPALGMTGFDGSLLKAKAKDFENLGFVGEVKEVNSDFLFNIISMGVIPVISPLAEGIDGASCYNINADTAAGSIAVALKASKLLFVTDVPGVLKESTLIENATVPDILSLIDDGTITGGMVPKVMAAINSLDGGMSNVMIVSGKNSLLNGEKLVGTTIYKELEAVY
ncbi:MAG TPA: acetylglutamate kinase [Bacillus bacterium]|uniref:Acetylglutamate kinase n=1 Tax=Siminovitchia fordii TaxID=254759 RepID=A0ABQ4K7L6_9BACI|nr:acetylglutamate kinase [Siminovitchia fordii]GIN21197.1 acetylglutamate kinase [Siminovitchia fordii]HBZ09576.1 acetylglutamate kinase [Bacillus sp. (in: firmicutes)]